MATTTKAAAAMIVRPKPTGSPELRHQIPAAMKQSVTAIGRLRRNELLVSRRPTLCVQPPM
jgi:hypothetical protein